MSEEVSDSLKLVVTNSLEALVRATPGFQDCFVNSPRPSETGLVTLAFGSSIAIKGAELNGCLAVSCTRELLQASHPSIQLGLKVDDAGLADWCGEITNQVVGRIKNRLSEMSVPFNMETPVRLPSAGSTFIGPSDFNAIHLDYESNSQPVMKVSFWIDSTLQDSMDKLAAHSADAGDVVFFSASEGEAILF